MKNTAERENTRKEAGTAGTGAEKGALGIYIHVPFCERKCRYCGFASLPRPRWRCREDYAALLGTELRLWRQLLRRRRVDTVFFGGGTPSLLRPAELYRILEALAASFTLTPRTEITVETNPNSLSDDFLRACAELGVGRISIGVQSFNDRTLHRLGRLHDSAAALRQIDRVRTLCSCDVNLDLIFATPEQTPQQWRDDLHTALRLRPEHLSFYSLQLEEGTPFYEQYRRGRIDLPDNDSERSMYHEAAALLTAAGYEHYEISNAALPGHRCRHNEKYWHLQEYLGLGPGASSYLGGERWRNRDDITIWSEEIRRGRRPIEPRSWEIEDVRDSMGVFCFTALRTREGIDRRRFARRFGSRLETVYAEQMDILHEYRRRGWLRITPRRLVLTASGVDHANEISCEFI